MSQLFECLRNLTDTRVSSPNSGIHQGAQVSRPLTVILLGLLTSQKKGTIRQSFTALRATLSALAILFGGLLFAHSAYATTPYLNVSSGAPDGLVSFNKVQPSSTGEMATASDTLTINTNCTVGYNVYVSAINGGETSLINDSDSAVAAGNNTISASSATIGGTAAVLTADTWGVNGNGSDASDGKYFGLPTYASATDSPLITKTSATTSNTVPIYYGAKVSTALAPGSYNGDVLYTVLPNNACTYYTVHYNANGGTGTMNDQDIIVGETTALSRSTFTRSGYTFLGWSNSANGKTGTATNGVGTPADVDYADKASVTDIADFNTTKQLYAIWALVTGNMQTWTGCSGLATSNAVYLKDARDNKVYVVKKLPDGKCWMMQNLTIGSSGSTNAQRTLTSANTNIDNNTTYYLPPAGKQGDITSSATLSSTTAANFISSNDNQAKTQFRSKDSSILNDSDTGYYNFYTATLGFSYYQDGKSSGTSTRDICPKGWRLPKTTDNGTTVSTTGTANDFTYLTQRYNTSASWSGTSTSYNYYTADSTIHTGIHNGAASPLATSSQNNYAGFSYSGYWNSTNTSASSVGSYGYYWSASVYDTNYGYRLYFNSSNVYPQYYLNKHFGYAARCIAQKRYTVNYNVNGASGSPSKTTDGTQYENASITTATVGSMTKTGYHFLGWSTNSSASSAAYSAGSSQMVSTMASAAGTADGGTITLYAIWAPNTFTISYSANSGSGSPSGGTTSATYGTNITMPAQGTLTRSGYDFMGWSLSSSATSATWTASQSGISPTAVKSNVTTVNGGSVTVYAVWKSSKPYMQTTSCSSLTKSSTTTLYDSRDEQAYTVYRWPSSGTAGTSYPSNMPGYCIMTKNLSLGYVTGGSITKGANLSLNTSTSASSGTITARTSASNWSGTNDDSNLQYINHTSATYGSYYSYGAAQKVCPKGWRPPTNAEWGYIRSFMGGDSSAGSSKIRGAPYNFVYGGVFNSGGWSDVGSYGYYWLSTQNSSSLGYGLDLRPARLSTDSYAKSVGASVRCISSN